MSFDGPSFHDLAALRNQQIDPVVPPPPPTPRRIPHMGHAIIFCGGTFLSLVFFQVILLALNHSLLSTPLRNAAGHNPKLMLASMALAYLTSLAIAKFVFPLAWDMPFALGLRWNAAQAHRQAGKLFATGLVLGWIVQASSALIPMPKSIPLDDFFRSRTDVWLVTIFGTLIAPLFEEVAFRGFLLPAFAFAFDWLTNATPPPPAGFESTNRAAITTSSLIASAVFTSMLFALLHAEQLAHAWAAVAVLFTVSLVLTAVRVRTQSVAASTLVHISYNFSVFLTLFLATGGYRHLDRMAR